MPVAVKLDEDLSLMVAEPLLAHGHDVASVLSQGWSGLPDSALWPHVCSERRLLVTADKGFGDLRRFPPGSHAGIVLLRADRESVVEYRTLIATLLEKHALEALEGCVTVVSPRGVRIRRPHTSDPPGGPAS